MRTTTTRSEPAIVRAWSRVIALDGGTSNTRARLIQDGEIPRASTSRGQAGGGHPGAAGLPGCGAPGNDESRATRVVLGWCGGGRRRRSPGSPSHPGTISSGLGGRPGTVAQSFMPGGWPGCSRGRSLRWTTSSRRPLRLWAPSRSCWFRSTRGVRAIAQLSLNRLHDQTTWPRITAEPGSSRSTGTRGYSRPCWLGRRII